MSPEGAIIQTLIRIPDKDANDVDFILNPEQLELDASLTGRDIVPKARQMGISTYVLARFLVKCLAYRNRRCVVVSHEANATERLLGRVHYMLKHLKSPEAKLKFSTRRELYFEKTDSAFYLGTAGSDNFGHGDTITDLHCSEVSRWENPQALLRGLFNAVPPSGNIIIESTGNGTGDWYHRACLRAARGIGFKLHFFNWLNRPEYRSDFSSEAAKASFMARLLSELEEQEYLERGLTPEQLLWRRNKITEMDYDLQGFKEQYPVSLDECFQASGHSFFKRVKFLPTGEWREHTPGYFVLGDHPKRGLTYVLGGDVGSGVGAKETNYSAAELFCLETGEQVAEFYSNSQEPDKFAVTIYDLAKRFNFAYINLERNNHGILTIKTLLDTDYPKNLIHKGKNAIHKTGEYGRIADYGTFTSEVTKALVIGALREGLATEWTIHSERLKSELDTFVEKENGKVEAQEGAFDDTVMAAAMAIYVVPKAVTTIQTRKKVSPPENRDPFALESLLNEVEERYSRDESSPIPTGVENDTWVQQGRA